ncbi:MAG: hypothetical protein JWQ59_2468 [Cryobacterium sp.]|nr:hypothetical protein [Cryobacterium sp.]
MNQGESLLGNGQAAFRGDSNADAFSIYPELLAYDRAATTFTDFLAAAPGALAWPAAGPYV